MRRRPVWDRARMKLQRRLPTPRKRSARSVTADAVKELAENIRAATLANQKHLEQLARILADLTVRAQSNAETAQSTKSKSEQSRQTIARFQSLVETVRHLIRDIDSMSQSVEQNSGSYAALRDELRGLTDAVDAGTGHLESAHRKADSI